MPRRILKDGKYYRVRRGKIVQIPPEWVGIVNRRGCTSPRNWKSMFKHSEKIKARNIELRFLRKEVLELGLNPKVLSL